VKNSKVALLTLIPISSLAILGVFASSAITVNSGNSVALGAGSQIVATCDNDVNLDPPGLSVDTTTGKFMITTISVSNVSQKNPSGCGNWIMELAASSSSGLQITSWSIPSSAIDAPFYFGASTIGTNMAKTSLIPIDPTQITTIALQMYPAKSCADGGTCSLGDTGPGGGPVIYVAPTPFTEPVSGKQFKYVEAAPTNWVSGVLDQRTQICNPNSVSSSLSEAIGYARYNTNVLVADSNCTTISSNSIPSGLRDAGALARSYGADWQVPTLSELIEMCKVARFGAAVAPTKTNCDDSGGTNPTSWLTVNYGSSSKISGSGWASVVNFQTGTKNNSSAVQSSNFGLRPIRYF